MRLIDADSIQIPHFRLATDRIKMIDAIDEAPTIEPKRGEWMPKNHHTDYCSVCGFEETQWKTVDYNFCPNCGAEVRKGADDER